MHNTKRLLFALALLSGIALACTGAVESNWIPEPRYADPGCYIADAECGYKWKLYEEFDILQSWSETEAERYGYIPQTGETIPLPLTATAHADVLCLEDGHWGAITGARRPGPGAVWDTYGLT